MWNAHKQPWVWLHRLMTRGRWRPRSRVCVRGGGGSGEVSASSYFKKKSHSLHLPPLLLQKSADHFLWLLAASSPAFLGLVFLYHFFILITAPSSTEVMTLPQLVFLSFPIRLTRLPPAYCLAPPGPFNEVLKRFPWADLTSWPSLSVAGHRCWSDWNRELLADIWLWTICL